MDSTIDVSAGIVLNKKVDDKVKLGDILAEIHTNDLDKGKEVEQDLINLYKIGKKNKESKKMIYGIVTKDGIEIY